MTTLIKTQCAKTASSLAGKSENKSLNVSFTDIYLKT